MTMATGVGRFFSSFLRWICQLCLGDMCRPSFLGPFTMLRWKAIL